MKFDEEQFQQVEQRLRRALTHEANRWTQQEPTSLRAACRSNRQASACRKRRHPFLWAGTAAAAGLLVLLAMRIYYSAFNLPDSHIRPAVVSNIVDCEALYNALPKIPAPARPPALVRLFVNRVNVISTEK